MKQSFMYIHAFSRLSPPIFNLPLFSSVATRNCSWVKRNYWGTLTPPSFPSYVCACSHDHDSQGRKSVRVGETTETWQCDRTISPSVFVHSVYRFVGNALTILVETSLQNGGGTSIFDWLPAGYILPSTSMHALAASFSPRRLCHIVKPTSRRI